MTVLAWTLQRRNSATDCNGKEKDWESGFHYYGARYYWSEMLTGWLSVDPMSDKYPSISPHAYCAWNPVRLIDPEGREIEYSSFKDELYVFAARILSKGFRVRYNDLKNSKETYVFNNNDKADNKLSTDGNKLYINYSLDEDSQKEGSTIISLLRHETEHAVQFEYGEVGFQKNEKGEWKPLNFDLNDELKARDFEAGSTFILNSKSIQGRWGVEGSDVGSREQQKAYLRDRCGYKARDVVWNNETIDVGKDGTKYALTYRKRDEKKYQ